MLQAVNHGVRMSVTDVLGMSWSSVDSSKDGSDRYSKIEIYRLPSLLTSVIASHLSRQRHGLSYRDLISVCMGESLSRIDARRAHDFNRAICDIHAYFLGSNPYPIDHYGNYKHLPAGNLSLSNILAFTFGSLAPENVCLASLASRIGLDLFAFKKDAELVKSLAHAQSELRGEITKVLSKIFEVDGKFGQQPDIYVSETICFVYDNRNPFVYDNRDPWKFLGAPGIGLAKAENVKIRIVNSSTFGNNDGDSEWSDEKLTLAKFVKAPDMERRIGLAVELSQKLPGVTCSAPGPKYSFEYDPDSSFNPEGTTYSSVTDYVEICIPYMHLPSALAILTESARKKDENISTLSMPAVSATSMLE